MQTLIEPEAQRVVLDTNVVFDWLVFGDPGCAALRQAIEGRRLRWIATPPMLGECLHVVGRGGLDPWAPDVAALRSAWAAHCDTVDPPLPGLGPAVPRCSDSDDQMFIDLAVARGARWLFSKDRAVLRVARQLAPLGVQAVTPADWGRTVATVNPDRERRDAA